TFDASVGISLIRDLLTVTVALVLSVMASDGRAQRSGEAPIVALVSFATSSDDPMYQAFRNALRDLGYEQGRSIDVQFRSAQGDSGRLPTTPADLVQLKADVTVVGNPPTAQAVRRATHHDIRSCSKRLG